MAFFSLVVQPLKTFIRPLGLGLVLGIGSLLSCQRFPAGPPGPPGSSHAASTPAPKDATQPALWDSSSDISEDVSEFVTNPTVRHSLLHKPFQEVGRRLGSLHYTAQSVWRFKRNAKVLLEQTDTYALTRDAAGNIHGRVQTPSHSLETYLMGENLYIRYDVGHMRQKTRREMDPEALIHAAFATFSQSLDLFKPVTWINLGPVTYANLPAWEFRVEKEAASADPQPVGPSLSVWGASQAKVLSLKGRITAGLSQGVVFKAELQGRLEITEPHQPPTELTLQYTHTMSDIGQVLPLKVPSSVAEFSRPVRNRNPVGFFQPPHLPSATPHPHPSLPDPAAMPPSLPGE